MERTIKMSNSKKNVNNCDYEEALCNDNTLQSEKLPIKEYGYGVRHIQAVLGFVCMFVFYIIRTHIGVTIVAMTSNATLNNNLNVTREDINSLVQFNNTLIGNIKNDGGLNNKNGNVPGTQFPNVDVNFLTNVTNDDWNVFRIYDWTKPKQELILSSFSVGSLIMLLPVGFVCQRLGGKLLLQIALMLNALSSIPLPWLAMVGGWQATGACRLLQGVSYGALNPSMHTIIGSWAPGSERGRVTNFVYAGGSLGTVVAHQLSGVLSDSALGWPSIFWLTGVLCFLTFALLTLFGASTPSEHKTITPEEKEYILSQVKTSKKRRVPWRQILSSRYAWAAFATHVGSAASFTFCLAQVPTYMHNVLGLSVKNSGLLTSLPFLVKFFISFLYGYLTDLFVNKKMMSAKNSRRLFNSIGEVGVTICLAAVSFTQNITLAVTLFVLCMTLHAAVQSGWMLTYIDLAPNYSGFLIATGSTLSQFFNGLVLPTVVAFVIRDLKNQLQWRIMFFTVASMAFFCNLIYVIFLTTETQEWNDYDYEEAGKDETPNKQEANGRQREENKSH